jgi:hypothetical protein
MDARERAGISIKVAGARESNGVELVFSCYKVILVSVIEQENRCA